MVSDTYGRRYMIAVDADETEWSAPLQNLRRREDSLFWQETFAPCLDGADLRSRDFCDERFVLGSFVRCDARGARFVGADLTFSDFKHADLRGVDFTCACLCLADLSRSDLRGANLSGADLLKADLRLADLREARLSGAYLRDACLEGARFNARTELPISLEEALLRGMALEETSGGMWGARL